MGDHELAVPARVHPTDPVFQRRMGGEEALEEIVDTLGEVGMAQLLGVGMAHQRAFAVTADLLERPGDALGLAGELDRRGVGQVFALAAHGGLDDVAEKDAHIAQDQQPQPHEHDGNASPGALAAGGAARRPGAPAEQHPPHQRHHEDAEQQADQAQVEAHVAIDDVAELMGHHPLKFGAVELFEGAAGDGDHRVAGGVAGGEGVDAVFAVEHIDLGHRRPGGDGHLLDHVEQAPLQGVARVARHQPPVEHLRHGAPAVAQGEGTDGAAAGDHPGDAGAHAEETPPVELLPETGRRLAVDIGVGAELGEDHDEQIGHHDQRRHRQDEEQDQQPGAAPGFVLGRIEIHAGPPAGGSGQNDTLGAAWIWALSSNSSSLASVGWPNMAAKTTGGKD